jgi:hypothetical protein
MPLFLNLALHAGEPDVEVADVQPLEELEAEKVEVLLLVQRPVHVLHKVLGLEISHDLQ